ncbi:MFS transporter [Myroides sp. JBRI-B21084]|uniref:MFS transporter n=1 Tax=Myroides sp. JBRI-B21084 TaxID=3119977 RepID=UPI0026E1C317|nr:MFS transporter [Paenimyroides cloacae]WKW46891.1 MFS transporter [Paenimyroides cloacae]
MKIELASMSLKVPQLPITKNIALAVAQIVLWGGSFFILSVLADPIMKETGWSHQMVYGVLSLSLLVSGLVSSKIGKTINEREKDYILLYSGVVMALGLTIIGLAQQFWIFILGWIIIGISMAMGLYDALFALLGKRYGREANKSIIQITLISGFAPTVSWFFVSHLLHYVDWRTACFIYTFVLLISVFPLHRFAFQATENVTNKTSEKVVTESVSTDLFRSKIFRLLLAYFTIGSMLMTGIVVHLIDILLSNEMHLATAVSIAALLGPSQVGVRVLDLVLPKKTAETTAVISAIAIFTGLVLLLISPKIAFLGVIVFGLGNGMRSILKGTLPLAIFGQKGYAVILGKLAGLPLIAQAVTPFIGGFVIQQFNSSVYICLLAVLALVNIILVVLVKKLTKSNNH